MTHLGQESSAKVWEEKGPVKGVSDAPVPAKMHLACVRTQDIERQSEEIQLSLQRKIRARDLLTPLPSQPVLEPATATTEARDLVASGCELLASWGGQHRVRAPALKLLAGSCLNDLG